MPRLEDCPERQARHAAWLATAEGRAYTAEQARPIEDRLAEQAAEHRAERLLDARLGDAAGRWVGCRPSIHGRLS